MYLVLEIIPSFWVFKGSRHNYTCILILNFEITYRILLIFIHRHFFVLIVNFINVFINIISMCEMHCIHIGMCVCMCMYVVCVSVGICEDKRTKKNTLGILFSPASLSMRDWTCHQDCSASTVTCWVISMALGPVCSVLIFINMFCIIM